MPDIVDIFKKCSVIPVIKIEDEYKAVKMAEALIRGGINVAEITLRTKSAAKSIEVISKKLPEMYVCAGTVLNSDQAEEAVSCGAKAIVSPGTNNNVVEWCRKREVPVVPGCVTPTEIENAMTSGLKVLKFFPAEAAGGVKMLEALYGPYSEVLFMPTGGINKNNVKDYLKMPNVFACGCSWIVSPDLLQSENYDEIQKRAVEIKSMI